MGYELVGHRREKIGSDEPPRYRIDVLDRYSQRHTRIVSVDPEPEGVNAQLVGRGSLCLPFQQSGGKNALCL